MSKSADLCEIIEVIECHNTDTPEARIIENKDLGNN